MTIIDSLTPETSGIIIGSITIIALLCGLFYKLGRLNNRIDTLEINVNNLLQETRGLNAMQRDVDRLLNGMGDLKSRLDAHILSVEAQEESEKIRKGDKK